MKERFKKALKHPLLLSFYLPSFLSFFAIGLLGPVTPLYLDSFDVSYTMVGLMLAMPSLGKIVFQIPGGILIPRLSIKKSMILGTTLIMLSMIGMFFSTSPLEVFLYQFLMGLGSVFEHTARLTFATVVTNPDNRGRVLAALGGTNRISRIFGPALGGILATTIRLQFPFIISGVFLLLALVIILIAMPGDYAQPRSTASNLPILVQVAKQNRTVLSRAGIGAFLLATVRMARFTLLPLFAANVLGLTASQVGIILSAASLADLLNVYAAGTLMDRYGRRWAAIPCVGVMALSMALMPFTTGFWGLMIVGVIAGAGNGFGSGIMMTIGSDLAPKGHQEEFLALWILILDLGGAACPLIVGGISTALSLTASGFAFFGIGILGVLAFLFLVPETRWKHKQTLIDTSP